MKGIGDIVFLTRLLKANDVLWIGEWLFHVSFFFVTVRHLRYFLEPVPACIAFLQTAGIIAGYLLPFTLLYILVVKLVLERAYVSSYNFFLLCLIFLLSATGLAMKLFLRVDIVAVKFFVQGFLRFSPEAAPGSLLFAAHVLLSLLLLLYLPTHLFTAPFTMLDAREREDGLRALLHEESLDDRREEER